MQKHQKHMFSKRKWPPGHLQNAMNFLKRMHEVSDKIQFAGFRNCKFRIVDAKKYGEQNCIFFWGCSIFGKLEIACRHIFRFWKIQLALCNKEGRFLCFFWMKAMAGANEKVQDFKDGLWKSELVFSYKKNEMLLKEIQNMRFSKKYNGINSRGYRKMKKLQKRKSYFDFPTIFWFVGCDFLKEFSKFAFWGLSITKTMAGAI